MCLLLADGDDKPTGFISSAASGIKLAKGVEKNLRILEHIPL